MTVGRIPWRNEVLTPTALAALLSECLGERTKVDTAERILSDLGAIVSRSDDTLYAQAPAYGRRTLGAKPHWLITGHIEPVNGWLTSLDVRYLSGK